MEKLNITDGVLDKLGFSEYWDENGDWGGRTLEFSNGTKFRIIEQCEKDDDTDGYASFGKYIAHHFFFTGFFAIPKIDNVKTYNLFFLHEMYECIKDVYPDCLDEFVSKCENAKMKVYIDKYLKKLP